MKATDADWRTCPACRSKYPPGIGHHCDQGGDGWPSAGGRLAIAETRIAELETAIREAQRYCYAMSDPPRAQRILRDALKGNHAD